MDKPQIEPASVELAPDFLTHLSWTFGWSEAQAIDALGAYITSTEAGRALRRALDSAEAELSVEAA